MDELKNAWVNIDLPETDSKRHHDLSNNSKNGQLASIRKGLNMKRYSNYAMIFLIILALAISNAFYLDLAISVVLLGHIISAIFLEKAKRKLNKNYDSSVAPLTFTKMYYNKARNMIRFDQLIGLVFYPFSILSGLLLGLRMSGTTYLIETWTFWGSVFLIYLTMIPLMYYLSSMINRRMFGAHLKALRKTIDELSLGSN